MSISGETGSGKSTQVPQYLLDDLVKNNQPGQIYVTQPRRIAATTVSEHVRKAFALHKDFGLKIIESFDTLSKILVKCPLKSDAA